MLESSCGRILLREGRIADDVGDEIEHQREVVLERHRVDERQVVAGADADAAAHRLDGRRNLLGAHGRRALIEQPRRHAGHAGLVLGIVRGAGLHEHAKADGRLLVVRDHDDLQAVGQRANLVRREVDVARGERARRVLARPGLLRRERHRERDDEGSAGERAH
jgi:hypothetical protein